MGKVSGVPGNFESGDLKLIINYMRLPDQGAEYDPFVDKAIDISDSILIFSNFWMLTDMTVNNSTDTSSLLFSHRYIWELIKIKAYYSIPLNTFNYIYNLKNKYGKGLQ